MEETTNVAHIDVPIREKMFVTTDENGTLKLLFGLGQSNKMTESTPLQISTLSHLKLAQVEVPSPSPRPPQAKPIVPHWVLSHPIPVTQSLALPPNRLRGYIQNASNTLPEPRVPVVPTVPVVSASALQHETPGSLLAHTYLPW